MGDIISGYTEIIPVYTSNKDNNELSLSISVISSDLYVILTPCCSIEQKTVNIAPLKKVEPNFLSSEYLIENFLLINFPISKRIALGDLIFSKFSAEEQLTFNNIPPSYEYVDKFVYDDYCALKKYAISKKRGKDDNVTVTTGKYMVSFKDVIKIQSELFDRNKSNCAKVAELTPMSRQTLRDKMSFYYSRIPEEDQSFLE